MKTIEIIFTIPWLIMIICFCFSVCKEETKKDNNLKGNLSKHTKKS